MAGLSTLIGEIRRNEVLKLLCILTIIMRSNHNGPPTTFFNIYKILNIVAPCVQQIVFMFWITPQLLFNSRYFSYSERKIATPFESTITPSQSKIISIILTFSRYATMFKHFLFIINSTFVTVFTECDRSFC